MRMTIFITDGVNTCKHFVFSVFYTGRNGIFSFSGQFFSAFSEIFPLFGTLLARSVCRYESENFLSENVHKFVCIFYIIDIQ